MNNSEIELLQLAASAANINVKFDFYESAFVKAAADLERGRTK